VSIARQLPPQAPLPPSSNGAPFSSLGQLLEAASQQSRINPQYHPPGFPPQQFQPEILSTNYPPVNNFAQQQRQLGNNYPAAQEPITAPQYPAAQEPITAPPYPPTTTTPAFQQVRSGYRA
jgi:hypothetical protein